MFKIASKYSPAGDQPTAIAKLVEGIKTNKQNQVLLGITGSGKTFTMANVIESLSRPTLIMAHNKTLAAQLYSEMKEIFPENAVEYFVSYYDYYQPEAYIPSTDKYIEKDASINEQIDRMRHSATRSLLERRDTIVVSSVSCIYGIGSPELYYNMTFTVEIGERYDFSRLSKQLISLQYERNDIVLERGKFQIKGDIINIQPSHFDDKAWRLVFFDDELEEIIEYDVLTGGKTASLQKAVIYANSHYVTPKEVLDKAVVEIKAEMQARVEYFKEKNMLVEAQRVEQRTTYDIEMLSTTGSCKGIENYSRYLTGRGKGRPPPTLFEYFPEDALLFVDESHVMVPQVNAMYNGDKARKSVLIDFGFRLPSASDNRPLTFAEWEEFRPQTIFVSATPAEFEILQAKGDIVEQIVRPTGLLDPECTLRPASSQVDDLISEIKQVSAAGMRILVTVLTKKMAEDLSEYIHSLGYNTCYMHSDIKTLERIDIIRDLRIGKYDVLVGINLLREGINIPECGLVAILDADKEGFLRSKTSLVQTIGRAARNSKGRVVLYADTETNSIKYAMEETNRRRKKQKEYNERHNITPTTIEKSIDKSLMENKEDLVMEDSFTVSEKDISIITKEMNKAAEELDFEKAIMLREKIKKLKLQIDYS